MRQRGIVTVFNGPSGWIRPDSDERDIFVHFSDIQTSGFKKLQTGDIVEYETKQGPRGRFAARVKVIEAAEAAA